MPTPPATPAAEPPLPSPDPAAARLLLMLHRAREDGDAERALRIWRLIVSAELPRVRAIVGAFRDPSLPGGRVPLSDRDDLTQDVFVRLHNKSGQLTGSSVGELRSFMATVTKYACLDYVRRHVRDDMRRADAFDADDDQTSPAFRAAVERLTNDLASDRNRSCEARALVHEALIEVDDNKRRIIVMDLQGYSTDEIAADLGLSAENVYQRRRRGLKQLREALLERDVESLDL